MEPTRVTRSKKYRFPVSSGADIQDRHSLGCLLHAVVRFGILVRSLWTQAIFLKIKRFRLVHEITLVCDTTTTPWAIYGNRMYRWVHYTIFMSIGVP